MPQNTPAAVIAIVPIIFMSISGSIETLDTTPFLNCCSASDLK